MHLKLGACREAGEAFMSFAQKQLAGNPEAVVVLVAHNLKSFDHIWLTREFMRITPDFKWPADWLFFDTVLFARNIFNTRPGFQSCSQASCSLMASNSKLACKKQKDNISSRHAIQPEA